MWNVMFAVLLFVVSAVSAQEWRHEQLVLGRSRHEVAFDPDRRVFLMFGGRSLSYARDEPGTLEWDGRVWHKRHTPQPPPAREFHALFHDEVRREIILFGGAQVSASGALLNDTWAWDGVAWKLLTPSVSPSPRAGHRIVYDPVRRQAVLFGGYGASGYLSETWIWNGVTWQQVSPVTSPPPRAFHGMTHDPARRRMLLHGGFDGASPLQDTWEWDGSAWTPLPGGFSRRWHGMAYDHQTGQVLSYGGTVPPPGGG
jgi:hypothetical protein